jgi:YVTN family beta-propeller protein
MCNQQTAVVRAGVEGRSVGSSSFTLAAFRLVTLMLTVSAAPAAARPFVYISNGVDTVFVIDAATNAIAATIGVGAHTFPTTLALAPDESRLYVVTNSDTGQYDR